MIRQILSPWVDATQIGIAWARYWLDYAEMICDSVEDTGEGYK